MRFADRQEWRRWLAAEHADRPDGVWIEMAKKASGIESVTPPRRWRWRCASAGSTPSAKSVDDDWFTQRFTPRRARSRWSRLMCEKAEELIASGAMQPAGLAEVERAKADGRWDAAYEPPSHRHRARRPARGAGRRPGRRRSSSTP